MALKTYVGARYAPKFEGKWDKTNEYGALSVVYTNNQSYVARQAVPAGTEITNTKYWIVSSDWNAQVDEYLAQVEQNNTAFNVLNTNVNAYKAQTDTFFNQTMHTYNTQADMQADKTVKAGLTLMTSGKSTVGDGGGSMYQVVEETSSDAVALQNGLWAKPFEFQAYDSLLFNNGGKLVTLSVHAEDDTATKTRTVTFFPNSGFVENHFNSSTQLYTVRVLDDIKTLKADVTLSSISGESLSSNHIGSLTADIIITNSSSTAVTITWANTGEILSIVPAGKQYSFYATINRYDNGTNIKVLGRTGGENKLVFPGLDYMTGYKKEDSSETSTVLYPIFSDQCANQVFQFSPDYYSITGAYTKVTIDFDFMDYPYLAFGWFKISNKTGHNITLVGGLSEGHQLGTVANNTNAVVGCIVGQALSDGPIFKIWTDKPLG